jgi:hypothetical protein
MLRGRREPQPDASGAAARIRTPWRLIENRFDRLAMKRFFYGSSKRDSLLQM